MSTGGNSDNYGAPTPQGSYIENTIIVQYDPLLQEVWDQARKIRCTWYVYLHIQISSGEENTNLHGTNCGKIKEETWASFSDFCLMGVGSN